MNDRFSLIEWWLKMVKRDWLCDACSFSDPFGYLQNEFCLEMPISCVVGSSLGWSSSRSDSSDYTEIPTTKIETEESCPCHVHGRFISTVSNARWKALWAFARMTTHLDGRGCFMMFLGAMARGEQFGELKQSWTWWTCLFFQIVQVCIFQLFLSLSSDMFQSNWVNFCSSSVPRSIPCGRSHGHLQRQSLNYTLNIMIYPSEWLNVIHILISKMRFRSFFEADIWFLSFESNLRSRESPWCAGPCSPCSRCELRCPMPNPMPDGFTMEPQERHMRHEGFAIDVYDGWWCWWWWWWW